MLKVHRDLWLSTKIQQKRQWINVCSPADGGTDLFKKNRMKQFEYKYCIKRTHKSSRNEPRIEMMLGKRKHRNPNVRENEVFRQEI